MKRVNIRLPYLLFVYTAIVLAALLLICSLYTENLALKQDLLKWQQKTDELKNELNRINRFTGEYGTSPEIIAAVMRESEEHAVDPLIMLELIKIESDFEPLSVSTHGAAGLCQIRPFTARELSAELGLDYNDELLFDADYNIKLAAYYLSKLLAMHDNDYHKALTAYNRGPTGLQKYLARTGTAVSRYSTLVSRAREQYQNP